MRPLLAFLLTIVLGPGPGLAQTLATPVLPAKPIQGDPGIPALEPGAQPPGGPPGVPAHPGQPDRGPRTPEQERSQLLQQFIIDRSGSGILQARLQATRPSQLDPAADPEGNNPAAPPPPEPVDPPNPAQQQQLDDNQKRQQYQQEVEAFRLHVVLGAWDKVRAYLDSLPPGDAATAYSRLLTQLATPAHVNPRPELALLGAQAHQQGQYLRPAEVLALSDAARQEPDRETLKQLATLVSKDATPPESFFAALRSGTRYFGLSDLPSHRRTAAFLLNAGLLDQAADYLPEVDSARQARDLAALNLIARFHAESHRTDPGKQHLPAAWALCLEILADKAAPLPERGEALYRALALVPELEDESGQAWLRETFRDPESEGFEILAAVGTLASQSRELPDAGFRLDHLKLQAAAANTLLAMEGLDVGPWTEILTVYALNWIHEARFSNDRDQNTSLQPTMEVDRFGNPYYIERTVNYDGRGNAPIPAGDLLENLPAGKWLQHVDEPVRLDCLAVTARLYLKLNEEAEAFPALQQLAAARPKQAEDLVREMISVWAANHNPNQAARYRSNYYYFYGANQRAETIPLTRSKQERNLRKLASLVQQVRALLLEERFEEEFADAFIQAHSQAEVWRVEALETVFGKLDTLDAATVAALLTRMRSNLASIWPNPKLQEEYKTKRRDTELAQHIQKGYAAAKQVAHDALAHSPDDWRLKVQSAALTYEESNYQSSLTPQSDHSLTKRRSLEALAAAASAYAATLPLETPDAESTEAFETWFYAALGSPDLAALKAHHQPVPAELPKLKAALAALPPDTVDRHLEKFATTLNNRLANVSPDLKYRFLTAALEVTGPHERIKSAADVFQYYQDLITEIQLVATLDGPDTVGTRAPFGLFVNLRHTAEIERESGGFQRYLQNQNNNAYGYNFGRPTEDYRDKFEKAARSLLDEHFEVLSLTFHESKIESRSDPVLGWRLTPYAYFLLQAKGPEVDLIPPLSIDLDFLDTSGYVVLPISSSALAIDAAAPPQPRPVRDLRVTLTLDERSASQDRSLFLDVKATGHGLVPPLPSLLALPPDGFTLADTEDRSLLVEQLDPATEDGAPLSTHEWRLKLVPAADSAPSQFTFPSVLVPTAAEDGLILQRYEDVDLVPVAATVVLGAKVPTGLKPWYLLVVVPVLALLGIALWIRLRASLPESETYHGPALPSTLTPVTLLSFLHRLHAYEGLPKEKRAELETEITTLQNRFFGPDQDAPAHDDLHHIAQRWKPAA